MFSSRVAKFVFLLFCAILLFLCGFFVSNVFSHCKDSNFEDKSTLWPSNDSQLIFAHVLYRHGQRNTNSYPDLYPNDPYINETHWPGGFGALTNEGKRQQFKLGQYFRRRYHKLLGDKYSPKKVYVRSTNSDRTLMSALANLAGLFPPNAEEKWHKDIAWQPIPVHTMPLNMEYLLTYDQPVDCPRYSAALKKYKSESPEVLRILEENKENILYWSKMCGSNLTTIEKIGHLYGILIVQKQHNKTLSDWARKEIEPNGALESIAFFRYKMRSNTRELARLYSGFLIKQMFERFAQKINSTLEPNRSLWFYSVHDMTIAGLLNGLGLLKPPTPPYASSVHLELYKVDEKEHYIQIFYRKSDEEILLPLNIPNCGEKCPLDQLYKLYNDIIPDRDHDTECRLP
ncbi:prostatic acid phosphatase-like [Contarinia nasturtii]|uniref:prostatic acid phosphatase-like n=1 Tax=Contarinia nasturtii TaxID=265458 RepID=UPI0012D46DE2|nr:prostatic acid phosphatase-like [Contarinia nasturtii]